MSASQKITKLSIIAGGGYIPAHLARACEAQGVEVFIVAFEGQTDKSLVDGRDHIWTRIGATGEVFSALRSRGIQDLVLIGGMRRPNWKQIKPDLKTLGFLAKAGVKMLGDDGLLSSLRQFLEAENFTLHGVQAFAGDILTPSGALGVIEPTADQVANIEIGTRASQDLGRRDLGQACVVNDDGSIVLEDDRGTDAMLAGLSVDQTQGAILVKTCKPQQDRDLDLPAMGMRTIERAAELRFAGVVLHAGQSLLLDREAFVAYADAHNMFVIGIEIDD